MYMYLLSNISYHQFSQSLFNNSLQEKKTNVHVKINDWSKINTLLHLNHVSDHH